MKICKTNIVGQYPVALHLHEDKSFSVVYGMQVETFDSMRDALARFESCTHHAMVCAGLLDDED